MNSFSCPIYLNERYGISRQKEPVRIGVPFPKGCVNTPTLLKMKAPNGKKCQFQSKVMSYWPDGSAKWVLIDFFAKFREHQESVYFLEGSTDSEQDSSSFSQGINILKYKKNHYLVDTGIARFELSFKGGFPFKSIQLKREKDIFSKRCSQVVLILENGKTLYPEIKEIILEENGPICASFLAKVVFYLAKRKIVNLVIRLTFYNNSSQVHLDICIHNPNAAIHPGGLWDLGDPGSIYFKGLLLKIYGQERIDSVEFKITPEGPTYDIKKTDFLIYQDSSGGKNWDSPNHIDKNGKLTVSFCGYEIKGAEDDKDLGLEKKGYRASPFIKANFKNGWVAGAVKDFWQNFPKSLNTYSNVFEIGLFPKECTSGYELQGGEQKRHTVFLEFGTSSDDVSIHELLRPIEVSLSPEWIEKCQVIPYFCPEERDPNLQYKNYYQNIIDGPHSFFKKREIIDEYGWRNFGDLYADHEAIHAKDKKKFISHYNNQYDFIFGAGVHFLRSRDHRWFELMEQYARHVIDIDIYHTDKDKPAYNHGLFWHTDHYRNAGRATHRTFSRDGLSKRQIKKYGGGPCNEHNYTSGLLLYYYLTGDPFAKDAVIELAKWVLDMDDGAKNILGLFDESPTGLASQTASPDYHGPGRGSGNSINALLDAYVLTGKRIFLKKAEELIQRCIHLKDDINSLHLDDPEYRWSYLVFLQILGRYLNLKMEMGEEDYNFFYAKEGLIHYSKWILENEVPYKEVLHKVEIPTETWPAHDIRKAWVLNVASKYVNSDLSKPMRETARFFFERSLKDVLSFETAYLTRPLVILATFGYIQGYFDKEIEAPTIFEKKYHFGEPVRFIPQRSRMKNAFKRKLKIFYHEINTRIKSKVFEVLGVLG